MSERLVIIDGKSVFYRGYYAMPNLSTKDGTPTGEYEDFMTGFLMDNDTTWGRPAGIAVTKDGALLVSDDANGNIFRVTRKTSK